VDAKRGLTFANGLRSILRLDPDLILLGEIRDSETASVAIEGSNIGRILLSTLHSRDAAGAVTSLRNLNLHDHEIATALEFVVAQRLVRKLCAGCRKRGKLNEAEVSWLHRIGKKVPRTTWRAGGCDACNGSGYSGRTGTFEVWRLNEDSYEMIRKGSDEHGLRQYLRTTGSHSLLENGLRKVDEGITDFSELRGGGLNWTPQSSQYGVERRGPISPRRFLLADKWR
jgi:general secretion pathway protein E